MKTNRTWITWLPSTEFDKKHSNETFKEIIIVSIKIDNTLKNKTNSSIRQHQINKDKRIKTKQHLKRQIKTYKRKNIRNKHKKDEKQHNTRQTIEKFTSKVCCDYFLFFGFLIGVVLYCVWFTCSFFLLKYYSFY